MDNGFYAMLFRMKHIKRWGIMHSVIPDHLSTHSLEVGFLAHSLAIIGNEVYGKNYEPERIVVKAIYHDVPEIFTGEITRKRYEELIILARDANMNILQDVRYMRDYLGPHNDKHFVKMLQKAFKEDKKFEMSPNAHLPSTIPWSDTVGKMNSTFHFQRRPGLVE